MKFNDPRYSGKLKPSKGNSKREHDNETTYMDKICNEPRYGIAEQNKQQITTTQLNL